MPNDIFRQESLSDPIEVHDNTMVEKQTEDHLNANINECHEAIVQIFDVINTESVRLLLLENIVHQ